MRIVVSAEFDGVRADRAVAALCDVSRSAAKRAMEAGDVTRADEPLRPSDAVAAGDELLVTIETPANDVEADDTVDFEIAFEDDQILVVDKPAGLVVHPGAGTADGTLANGLLARYPWAADLGAEHRWGIVHRLDRDTSGLLMVAKTVDSHRYLQDALRERAVSRRYRALAAGAFTSITGTIEAPIGRDPSNPTRMAVTSAGRPARTHYRAVAAWDEPQVTLLAVELETGRTHQIRVHLQAIDHPIVGDPVYRLQHPVSVDVGRTWLHATELVFPHPAGLGSVTAASALPKDLLASLDRLGAPSNGSVPS